MRIRVYEARYMREEAKKRTLFKLIHFHENGLMSIKTRLLTQLCSFWIKKLLSGTLGTARGRRKESPSQRERKPEPRQTPPPRGEQAGWSRIKQYPLSNSLPKIQPFPVFPLPSPKWKTPDEGGLP